MKGRGEKKTSPTSAIGDTGGPKKTRAVGSHLGGVCFTLGAA